MANGTITHAADMPHYLEKKGFRSWALTLDHKRLGVMYLFTILIFFIIAGIMGLLIRLELFTPGKTLMGPETFNQIFTIHGAVMIFIVIVPGISATFGNFLIPLMIGARDVIFPRLNLLSFWIYVSGALIALIALLHPMDTGWTFYTPYSIKTGTSVIPITFGAFVMGFSSILTGINFIVTIHKLRAPGMTWHRMPLFIWAAYSTAVIQVMATPVIAITLLLLIAERIFGIGFFDPAKGGDPILFQHFFWFYSHPVVYIMILPAFGVLSEILPVFCKKPIFGYKAIAYSSLAIAFISFLVWGHHLFLSGQSYFINVLFSFITFVVAIPTAIKIWNWLATMYKASIDYKTPMLYAVSFIFLFTIAGLTGVFLGTLPIDVHLHDTYFVVAHFHYTMMGGTIFMLFAAMHFWFPKMSGRMYHEAFARVGFLFQFVGFNLTFIPQFFMGMLGMPRRYYDYLPEFTNMHQLSTIGSWLLGLGTLLILINLSYSLFRGKKAPSNPWGSLSLEWQTSSPPRVDNFREIPIVTDWPYAYGKPTN